MIRTLLSSLTIAIAAATLAGGIAQAQSPRPDTDFCARMRAKDPGGMCNAKGEYVTADKVYKPDGTVVSRSTGG